MKKWSLVGSQWSQVLVVGAATEGEVQPGGESGGEAQPPSLPATASLSPATASCSAYWKIVLKRLVDSVALHIRLSSQRLVNTELEKEIVNEVMGPHGGGLERMLEEPPSLAGKRDRLNRSISLLRESKDVVAKGIDRIAAFGD